MCQVDEKKYEKKARRYLYTKIPWTTRHGSSSREYRINSSSFYIDIFVAVRVTLVCTSSYAYATYKMKCICASIHWVLKIRAPLSSATLIVNMTFTTFSVGIFFFVSAVGFSTDFEAADTNGVLVACQWLLRPVNFSGVFSILRFCYFSVGIGWCCNWLSEE